MTKPTCGPLYLEGINKWGYGQPGERAYAAGFVTGQAEKVYLGACPAAMFRPSMENQEWLCTIIQDVCDRYSLGMHWMAVVGGGWSEVWIYRDGHIFHALRRRMEAAEPDSPEYHVIRAALCGIPAAEIDLKFHERRGAGQPCDRKNEKEQ